VAQSLEWVDQLRARFSDKIISYRESAPGEPEITVSVSAVRDVLMYLKNLEGGAFEHMADLTAYDELPKTPRFYVVYELISMTRKQRCAVICPADETQTMPSVPTATDLWKGANWLEREVFDLMGIEFVNHPDMRRILLPTQFVGHPLQKDFVVDYRQQFPETENTQVTFDPFGNSIVETTEET